MLDTSYRGGSGPGGRQPALHVGPSTSQRSSSWLQSGSQTFPTRAAEVAVSTESSSTTSKTPSREASPGSNNLTHSTTTSKTTRSISSVHPLPTRIVRPASSPPATSSLLPTSSNNEATNERPHSILRRTRRQPSDAREEDESEGNSTRRSERRIRFADPVYNNNTSSSSSSSHSTPLVMPGSPHTPVPTTNALGPPQSTGSGGDSSTTTTELEEEPALWRAARGTALPYKQQQPQQPKVLLSLPKEELSASDDEDALHHSTHTATPPRADSQRAKYTSETDIHSRPHVSALDRLDLLVHPSDSSDFSPHNHSAHSQASSSSSAKMMHGKGMTTTLKERGGSHGGGGAVEDITLSALSASSTGTGAHPTITAPHVTHDAAPDMTSAISDRSSLPSEPSADRATLPQLSSHSNNSDSGTMSSDDEDNVRARHARRDDIDDRDVSEGVDPTDLHLSDDDEEESNEGSDMKLSEAHTPPPAQPQSRQGLPERSVTSRASSRVLTSPPSHSSTSSSSEEEEKDKAKHVKDGKATHHRHHHKNAHEKLVVLVRKDNLSSGAREKDAEVQLSVLPIERAAELLGRSAESLKKLMGNKETEEEEEEERVALRRALRTSASRSPSRERHRNSPAVSHLTDAAAHDTNAETEEEGEEGGAIRNALFDRSPTQLLTMHMNLFPKLPSVNGSAGRVPSSYFSSYTTTTSTTMIQADMNGNGGAVAGSRQSSTEAAALDAAPSNLVQRLLQSSTPRGTNSNNKETADRSSKASRTAPSASQREGRQDGMVNGVPVWMAQPVMRAAVPLVSHPLQTTHNKADNNNKEKKKSDHEEEKQTKTEESQRNKTTRTATPTPPRPTTTTRKDTDSEDGAQVAEYVLLSPRPDKAIQRTPNSKKSETAQNVARQITAEAAAMQAARRSLYSPKADRYVAPMLSPRATGLASDDAMRRYTTPSPRTRQGLSRGRSGLSSARSPLAQREYYKDYHAMHDSPIVAHDYYYSPPASQNVSPRWRSGSSSAQRAREELAYLMKSAKAGAASRSGDDGVSHYSHALSQLDSAKVYFGKGKKGRRRSSTREKNKGRHDYNELSSVRHRSDSKKKKKEKERSEHHSHSTHHTSRKRHDSSASRSRHERHGTKDKKAQRYLLVEPATESTTRSRAPSHTTNSASALSRERHRSPSTSHHHNHHHNSHKSRERSRHHDRSRSTSRSSYGSKRRDSSRHNDNRSKENALSEPVRHTITFGSAPLPRHSVTSVPLLVRDVTNEAKKKEKEKKDKKKKKKAAESMSDTGHHHHHHRDGSRSHRKDDYEERSEKSHNRKEKSRHNSRHHHHHSETDMTSSERLTKLDEMIAEWKREEKAANKSKAQTYTGEAHPTSRHGSRHESRSKESTSHKKKKHHHSHHYDKSYSRHKADEESRHGSRLRRTASSPGRLTGSSARRVPQSEIRQGEERAQRRRAIRAALQAIRSRPNTASEDPAKFWTPDLIADVKDYYYHGTRLRRGSLGSSLSTSAPSSLNVPTSLLIQRYAALWQQRQAAQRATSPQADHFTDNEYEENENENTKTKEVNVTGPMRSHGPRLSPLPEKLPGAFAQGNLDALVDTPRSGSLNEDHIHGQYRASARETIVNGYPKPSPEMVSVQLDEYDDAGNERPESPQHIETSPASSTVSSTANDTVGVSANRSQLNQRGSENGAEEEERVVVDTRALLTFARGVCRIVHALENYGEA